MRICDCGILLLVSLGAGAAAADTLDVDSWAEILHQEHTAGAPLPVIRAYGVTLTVEQAYAVQRAFVALLLDGRAPAGYKLAFSSLAAQQRMRLPTPAFGVLPAGGQLPAERPIPAGRFGKLMLETELGYRPRRAIERPLLGVQDLRNHIGEVLPVIELPDLGYDRPGALSGVDVIASNTAAAAFITGQPRPLADFEDFELDGIYVGLSRDGKTVNRAKAAYTLDGQWSALLWLIETALDQGYRIEPGQLLITGLLGTLVPGLPGRYRAEYGPLGIIDFEIASDGEGVSQ